MRLSRTARLLIGYMATLCGLASAAPVHFDLPASDSLHHRLSDFTHARALVLVFLSADCPISNRYSPLLRDIAAKYRARNVGFLSVFSDPGETPSAVAAHLSEYSLDLPGLLDPGASLARQTGVRVTPSVAVLSPAGAVLYRGRIDNRYVTWGRTRAEATRHDLVDALDAVLAGRLVPESSAPALGCAISGL